MQLQELKKIGLTSGEIKIYDALLELGECTKTALAKTSGVSPSNIYDITNRLVEKGIISKVEKNGVAHFSPTNPHHLLDFLEQKEKEIQEERSVVNEILPSLLLKFSKAKEKVNVEVLQGWNGMKTVFEDLIRECSCKEKNYIFGASLGEAKEKADRFFLKYSKLREKKGIITNIIFNENLRKRKERVDFFIKSKKCNVRFLNQSTPTEILFYKNISCIILLTKDPLVIRINSKEVKDSFKQHFDILWETAKC